jgi:hypothetical protein
VLLVSLSSDAGWLEKRFRSIKLLRMIETNAGWRQKRPIYLYVLDGFESG